MESSGGSRIRRQENNREYYGLDAEIHAKLDNKYGEEEERQALQWIEQVTGVQNLQHNDLHEVLKDGVVLCQLINALKPGTILKYNLHPKNVLAERENIQWYIDGCVSLGVPPQDLFIISDLHRPDSIYSVIKNIYALGRQAQVISGFKGPKLGVTYTVTEEDKKRREEEKMKEALKERERHNTLNIHQTLRRQQLENQKKQDTFSKRVAEEERANKRREKRGGSQIQSKTASDERYEKKRKQEEEEEEGISISPVRYGMDLEIKERMDSKHDLKAEEDAMDWIENVTKQPIDNLYDDLKSGVVLCQLINIIQPNFIPKINMRPVALMERENIQIYLNACSGLGVPAFNLFVVSDLYEKKNLTAVVQNIHALARAVEGRKSFVGPRMGNKQVTRIRQPSLSNIKQSYGSISHQREVAEAAATQSCCSCVIL